MEGTKRRKKKKIAAAKRETMERYKGLVLGLSVCFGLGFLFIYVPKSIKN